MDEPLLYQTFERPTLDSRLEWLNTPHNWSIDQNGKVLRIEPDAHTDLWQKTHYGFEVDNAHCLLASVKGNFALDTRVRFQPVHQYDQAGLVVRIAPTCWLKTSVEFEPDEPSRLGVVVTNAGYSDWSTQQFPSDCNSICLRVRRQNSDYLVDYSLDGEDWSQIRMAHLHEDRDNRRVDCGLYACSPTGKGFVAEFSFLRIQPVS